jgi:hypothetical protein
LDSLRRARFRWSFRFGRWEHFFSHLLFVVLLFTFLVVVFLLRIGIGEKYLISVLFLISTVILVYLLYFFSHTLEKVLRP